jgi:hypothetical protein
VKRLLLILVALSCVMSAQQRRVATLPSDGVPVADTDAATKAYVDTLTGSGIKYADRFAGADASIKINACIAAVIAAGGGTCDARGLTGTQTFTQQVNVGNGTVGVNLILPASGSWVWSGITDGTSCGMKLYSGASVQGFGMANGPSRMTFRTSGTVSMDAFVCTDPDVAGDGSYIRFEPRALIYPQSGATFTTAVVKWQQLFDASYIRDVTISTPAGVTNTTGLYINNPCCSATFEKVVVDGQYGTNNTPVHITQAGTVGTQGISFINVSFDHPGAGKPALLIDGGLNTGPMSFFNLYIEGNTTDTTTPLVSINVAKRGVNFYGGALKHYSAGSTAYCIDNASGANSGPINVHGLSCNGFGGGSANAINDRVAGVTVVSDASARVENYNTSHVYAGGVIPGNAAAPTCAAATRGLFWYVPAAAGAKDDVQVCAKAADNSYAWRTIY